MIFVSFVAVFTLAHAHVPFGIHTPLCLNRTDFMNSLQYFIGFSVYVHYTLSTQVSSYMYH